MLRVRLPADRMTPKQWKERCGEVFVYQMNSPMRWEQFKELPRHIQTEYLLSMRDRYGANAASLALMFGVKPLTVRRFVAAKELEISFPVGKSMTKRQREAWDSFLAGKDAPREAEQPVELARMAAPEKAAAGMSMRRFSLRFDGALDAQQIVNSLQYILGAGRTGSIEISCDLV